MPENNLDAKRLISQASDYLDTPQVDVVVNRARGGYEAAFGDEKIEWSLKRSLIVGIATPDICSVTLQEIVRDDQTSRISSRSCAPKEERFEVSITGSLYRFVVNERWKTEWMYGIRRCSEGQPQPAP